MAKSFSKAGELRSSLKTNPVDTLVSVSFTCKMNFWIFSKLKQTNKKLLHNTKGSVKIVMLYGPSGLEMYFIY